MRPHGIHGLSLIDDLSDNAIAGMRATGFRPALVVETSPKNFQVWLNHGRILGRELSSHAAKELAVRFGADLSSADWRHFGRLAGFTNQKQERRLENELAPFVKLHEWSGLIYTKANEFLGQVMAEMTTLAADRTGRQADRSKIGPAPLRSLADFHFDARYGGDLHRADMAWADYAASRGLSAAEIEQEILNARDLSKKGQRRRQLAYAERTVKKAFARSSVP